MYYITCSGREIDLEKITVDDICLSDIAHHLSSYANCRYGGALELGKHYSVANHSISLCRYARDLGLYKCFQKALIMHDASEYILRDLPSGLKALLPDYKKLEKQVEELIRDKYQINTSSVIQDVIKEYDTRIVLDEALEFIPQYYYKFSKQTPDKEPLGITLYPDSNPTTTKNIFLHYCNLLGIKD